MLLNWWRHGKWHDPLPLTCCSCLHRRKSHRYFSVSMVGNAQLGRDVSVTQESRTDARRFGWAFVSYRSVQIAAISHLTWTANGNSENWTCSALADYFHEVRLVQRKLCLLFSSLCLHTCMASSPLCLLFFLFEIHPNLFKCNTSQHLMGKLNLDSD